MSEKKHEGTDHGAHAKSEPKAHVAKGEAKAADKTEGKAPERVKDTRKILKAVQLPQGATVKTYATEDDMDALEKVMTPEMHRRLLAREAISGNWTPGAESVEPMTSSPEGANPVGTRGRGKKAQDENDALKRQVADLQRRLDELEGKGHGKK